MNYLISAYYQNSFLNYALSCGRFEKLEYLLDQGVEPSDASISILLNDLSFRTDRFPRNNYPLSCEMQMTVQYHLEVQDILELLLSRRPQLIDESWNGAHSVPLQVAIRNSQICLVIKLIQYGANLEGMEELTLEIIFGQLSINSYPLIAANMRQWIGSALVGTEKAPSYYLNQ